MQQLVDTHAVGSQTELAELLAAQGVQVTQGTISKDLLELRAVRRRDTDGALRYVIVEGEAGGDQASLDRLARLCGEVLLDAQASANLVVARTPPGAAQYFASALDKAMLSSVLGTIAGDDTVLLISTDPQGGDQVAAHLMGLAGGRRSAAPDPKPSDSTRTP